MMMEILVVVSHCLVPTYCWCYVVTELNCVDDVMESSDLRFQMNWLLEAVQKPTGSVPMAVGVKKNNKIQNQTNCSVRLFSIETNRFVLCAHIIEKGCIRLMPIQWR